jgi:hypothetical protein
MPGDSGGVVVGFGNAETDYHPTYEGYEGTASPRAAHWVPPLRGSPDARGACIGENAHAPTCQAQGCVGVVILIFVRAQARTRRRRQTRSFFWDWAMLHCEPGVR